MSTRGIDMIRTNQEIAGMKLTIVDKVDGTHHVNFALSEQDKSSMNIKEAHVTVLPNQSVHLTFEGMDENHYHLNIKTDGTDTNYVSSKTASQAQCIAMKDHITTFARTRPFAGVIQAIGRNPAVVKPQTWTFFDFITTAQQETQAKPRQSGPSKGEGCSPAVRTSERSNVVTGGVMLLVVPKQDEDDALFAIDDKKRGKRGSKKSR